VAPKCPLWVISGQMAIEKQTSIHNSGYSATREEAMAHFKALWLAS
jgi:hypothetical protein